MDILEDQMSDYFFLSLFFFAQNQTIDKSQKIKMILQTCNFHHVKLSLKAGTKKLCDHQYFDCTPNHCKQIDLVYIHLKYDNLALLNLTLKYHLSSYSGKILSLYIHDVHHRNRCKVRCMKANQIENYDYHSNPGSILEQRLKYQ